jgi:hemoglobin-like flavoprotein
VQIHGSQPAILSLAILLNAYGHHHPDYLSDAVEKIAKRETTGERKAPVSGAVIPLPRNSSL